MSDHVKLSHEPRNMDRRLEGQFEYLLDLLPCPRVSDYRSGHLGVGRRSSQRCFASDAAFAVTLSRYPVPRSDEKLFQEIRIGMWHEAVE